MLEKHNWLNSSEQFRNFFESMDDLIAVLISVEGRILDCNSGFQKVFSLLEKPTGEDIGKYFDEVKIEDLGEILTSEDGSIEFNQYFGTDKGQFVSGVAYRSYNNYLLLCEKISSSPDEMVGKISDLNCRLMNTARELAKEKIALDKALKEIKTLRGLIPICSYLRIPLKVATHSGVIRPPVPEYFGRGNRSEATLYF